MRLRRTTTLVVGLLVMTALSSLTAASSPHKIESDSTPLPAFGLSDDLPSVFTPTTEISYAVSQAAPVTLEVFDIFGNQIALLVNESQEPGRHEVTWDGKTSAGAVAPNGVYFYRLKSNGMSDTKKILIITPS